MNSICSASRPKQYSAQLHRQLVRALLAPLPPSVRLNDYVEAGYSSRKIASSLSQNTVQVSVCPSIGRER
jgi:hypothetical protein